MWFSLTQSPQRINANSKVTWQWTFYLSDRWKSNNLTIWIISFMRKYIFIYLAYCYIPSTQNWAHTLVGTQINLQSEHLHGWSHSTSGGENWPSHFRDYQTDIKMSNVHILWPSNFTSQFLSREIFCMHRDALWRIFSVASEEQTK